MSLKQYIDSFMLMIWKPKVIEGLQDYLSGITPADVPAMVKETRFPPVDKLNFGAADGYSDILHSITEEDLIQFIAEARPDLAEVILLQGQPGIEYIFKLREFYLDMLDHPEKALSMRMDQAPQEEMKKITCTECGKSFPVAASKLESIKECPYCKTQA